MLVRGPGDDEGRFEVDRRDPSGVVVVKCAKAFASLGVPEANGAVARASADVGAGEGDGVHCCAVLVEDEKGVQGREGVDSHCPI